MHGAAVKLPEVFDLRQFIDESGREQKHATGNALAGLEDRGKPAISTLDIPDFHLTEFDRLVAPQLVAADLQEFRGARAVTGEEPVEDASRFIPWMSCIAHKHAAQTSTEHQCRTQTSRPAADDDGIEHVCVRSAGRLRWNHNGNLKSSATAQDENQDE
jgi:hypothetical protein